MAMLSLKQNWNIKIRNEITWISFNWNFCNPWKSRYHNIINYLFCLNFLIIPLNSVQQLLIMVPLSRFIKLPSSFALINIASFILLLNIFGSLSRIIWFSQSISWPVPEFSWICLKSPLLVFFVFMSDLWPISLCLKFDSIHRYI